MDLIILGFVLFILAVGATIAYDKFKAGSADRAKRREEALARRKAFENARPPKPVPRPHRKELTLEQYKRHIQGVNTNPRPPGNAPFNKKATPAESLIEELKRRKLELEASKTGAIGSISAKSFQDIMEDTDKYMKGIQDVYERQQRDLEKELDFLRDSFDIEFGDFGDDD